MRTIILGLLFGVGLVGQLATVSTFSGTVGAMPASCTDGTFYWATDATGGQNFRICSNNVFVPLQPVGTAVITPPPSSQGVGDFWVVRTNPTTLTIGANCSTAFPCRVAFGTAVYSLTGSATAVIGATTDIAYIYVSTGQVLTVGTTSQVVTCTNCTAVTGVSAFPADSVPLWNWTSTSGVWDVSGGLDQRTIVQKGADPLGPYLITKADTQLKNAVNMGALASGIVKSTVSGGVSTPSVVSDTTTVNGQSCALAGSCTVTAVPVAGNNVTVNGQTCTLGSSCTVGVTRGLSFSFDGGGAALVTGKVLYIRVPFACTIANWSILSTTAETVTVTLWRVATGGTAIPAVGNTISTSGVSLSSGTAVYSTTVSDFTSTTIATNDLLAANLSAVTASQFVNYTLGCTQ